MKVAERPPKQEPRGARKRDPSTSERSAAPKTEQAGKNSGERGLLFDDPYWDDVFCSYYDPTLRTCCR
jgi:hypothetical protein